MANDTTSTPTLESRGYTPDDVVAARKFWRVDRAGWPLDRALRVWLAYELKVEWGTYDRDTDTFHDGPVYTSLFNDVIDG